MSVLNAEQIRTGILPAAVVQNSFGKIVELDRRMSRRILYRLGA